MDVLILVIKMLTPNSDKRYKYINENLPGTSLRVSYRFAWQFPTTFPGSPFLKNWVSNGEAGFNSQPLQAVNSIIYLQKTMTA